VTLRRAVEAVLLIALALVLVRGVVTDRCPSWIAPIIWLSALLLTFVLERQRYTPAIANPAGPWTPTDEKFIDPVSGERLRVFVNPATGERDYRPLT
jgi:hypothetical protein